MKRLFDALSKTGDGAFVIDAQFRVIFWNRAAETILGYTGPEAIGRYCYQIMGGRDETGTTLCQRYCRLAMKARRGDAVPSQELRARTKAREDRWLNVTTFVYPTDHRNRGNVVVHLFRDISHQKDRQHFVDWLLAEHERLQQVDRSLSLSPVAGTPQLHPLTDREQQVLGHLVQGSGTEEIASQLIISPTTVRNHIQNILGKLGVHSRLEAIAYAYQYGMVDGAGTPSRPPHRATYPRN